MEKKTTVNGQDICEVTRQMELCENDIYVRRLQEVIDAVNWACDNGTVIWYGYYEGEWGYWLTCVAVNSIVDEFSIYLGTRAPRHHEMIEHVEALRIEVTVPF